jgi:multidrug efflux pump subunit AcrA (membrane-fusion protein)
MPASLPAVLCGVTAATLSSFLIACRQTTTSAAEQLTVPTATARPANLTNELVLTAEFTPYQDVDVMAKVAGYVKNIRVDIGDHVREGDLLATLEVPELQNDMAKASAGVAAAQANITTARAAVTRAEAGENIAHLSFQRIQDVSVKQPGLVPRQEVDVAQAHDLEAAAQLASAQSALRSAQEMLTQAESEHQRTVTMLQYATIRAPFTGVITKRYANTGSMIQAGISSQTQAMPVVRLAQNNLLRLTLPVPVSAVADIHNGNPVEVNVTTLNRTFAGKITRSADSLETSTYLRQAGFRLQDSITPKLTLAVALENSQYQFSASNASPNFFFGNAGAAGGLNNPSANYTNQVAPDVLVKAAYEPGYGHYEIGGVVRFFRDRYYPTTTTAAGAQNDTVIGGGFVANARFAVTTKFDVGLHVLAGDGTGRYGVALLPDVTVHPDGTLVPLRNAQGLLSLEFHPNKRLDIFGYAGSEYVQRTFYVSGTGTLVGYAPTNGNNVGCGTEAVPTAGTGYAPGASPCLGATRDISQYSAGWVYRIYSGPAGKLQYGAAYSYLARNGWTGVGGAPKATNNFVYTSFRYYIP